MINCPGYNFLSILAKNGQSDIILVLVLESKGPYYYQEADGVKRRPSQFFHANIHPFFAPGTLNLTRVSLAFV